MSMGCQSEIERCNDAAYYLPLRYSLSESSLQALISPEFFKEFPYHIIFFCASLKLNALNELDQKEPFFRIC